MPRPYSEDLRWRVVAAVETGQTVRAVGALFQVSPALVSAMHRLWRLTGQVHSKQIGGYRRALLEPFADRLREHRSEPPALTLKALQGWLAADQGVTVSVPALDQFIRHQLGYRYKKNGDCQRTSTARCRKGPAAMASLAATMRSRQAGFP